MRILLVFGMAIGLIACSIQQHPLAGATAAKLTARQLVTTARYSPPFATVQGAALGSLFPLIPFVGFAPAVLSAGLSAGGVHQAAAGIVRDNGIADPAPAIARELSGYLKREYGVTLAPQPIAVTVLTGEEPTQLTAAYPSADLILDVETTGWGVERFSIASGGACGVKYIARLRLIDAKTVQLIDGKRGSVIADGTCIRIPQETATAPTCRELMADGARRFKSELEASARACVDEFRSKVLAHTAP